MGNDRVQGHGIEARQGRSTPAGSRRVAVAQHGPSYGFSMAVALRSSIPTRSSASTRRVRSRSNSCCSSALSSMCAASKLSIIFRTCSRFARSRFRVAAVRYILTWARIAATGRTVSFSPNPPMDTDGRREDTGRRPRSYKSDGPGSIGVDGRSAEGL